MENTKCSETEEKTTRTGEIKDARHIKMQEIKDEGKEAWERGT